jgi:hypothetical protein
VLSDRLSAKLEVAIHVMNGNTVLARLCEREPMHADELDSITLGLGVYGSEGGHFTLTRRGWIECLVVIWGEELVISRPSYLPLFGQEGQHAKCGPLKLETEG